MNTQQLGDQLHRMVKLAMDTGEAATLADAQRLFAGYQLGLEVGPDAAASPTLQAAILTVVNTGRRCFLGGVQVAGSLDIELRHPWPGCRTLAEAILDLSGQIVERVTPGIPRIIMGDVEPSNLGEFAVRATFDGWSGGIVPWNDSRRLAEQQECPPAGVLAGAVAVAEAFQYVRGSNTQAGRRDVGLSFWRPEATVDWLTGPAGPPLELLPSQLWLIGLGHLGQAYLWTLGFLPYAHPADVQLVLQDFDVLVPANDSTSPLTCAAIIGEKKTRAMARWCEMRGFRTMIHERRFAADFQRGMDEPGIALCGVDNALARAALEDVGFQRVIEAGLGRGTQEYLAFQVHTFPARRSARERWGNVPTSAPVEALVAQPAYQALSHTGMDQCGLTTLAGRSVGATFVGATTAALVIAEALRMLMGDVSYEVIDGTLRSLTHRQAIVNTTLHDPFNPGYTLAQPYHEVMHS